MDEKISIFSNNLDNKEYNQGEVFFEDITAKKIKHISCGIEEFEAQSLENAAVFPKSAPVISHNLWEKLIYYSHEFVLQQSVDKHDAGNLIKKLENLYQNSCHGYGSTTDECLEKYDGKIDREEAIFLLNIASNKYNEAAVNENSYSKEEKQKLSRLSKIFAGAVNILTFSVKQEK